MILIFNKTTTGEIETMNKLVAAATFNWKTNLIGLAGVVLGVIQGLTQDTTLSQLFHDGRFGLLLLIAILGFVSKDGDAHGTPNAPIAPAQAAQIAAVAESVAPTIGPVLPNSTHIFEALPGDLTPVGQSITVGGITYRKISATLYEKQP